MKGASAMASARTVKVGPRAVLAGDGGLLMTAACALVMGLASLLGSVPHAPIVAWTIGMAVAVFAPLLAWRLHRRHADGSATGGALLGYIAGGVLLFILLMLGAIVARIATAVGLFGTADDAGNVVGVIAVVAIVVAYLVVVAWLDVDALRDLSPKRHEHAWLDIVRLVATGAFVAYLVGVIVWATGASDVDDVGLTLLLVAPGAIGAAVVTVADMIVRRDEQRSHGNLISGV
jgi:hypothetical protein